MKLTVLNLLSVQELDDLQLVDLGFHRLIKRHGRCLPRHTLEICCISSEQVFIQCQDSIDNSAYNSTTRRRLLDSSRVSSVCQLIIRDGLSRDYANTLASPILAEQLPVKWMKIGIGYEGLKATGRGSKGERGSFSQAFQLANDLRVGGLMVGTEVTRLSVYSHLISDIPLVHHCPVTLSLSMQFLLTDPIYQGRAVFHPIGRRYGDYKRPGSEMFELVREIQRRLSVVKGEDIDPSPETVLFSTTFSTGMRNGDMIGMGCWVSRGRSALAWMGGERLWVRAIHPSSSTTSSSKAVSGRCGG